jgi:ribonucleoside-diphosphate reductase alpha chain
LKTTYYLRTLGASNIEKATVTMKRQKEEPAGQVLAEVEDTVAACRLDAMLNGGVCEACQ